MKPVLFLTVLVFFLMLHKATAAAPEPNVIDCKDGREAVGDLGITSLSFKGTTTYHSKTGESDWYFQGEPKILGIDENGPAGGKLESGDVIVSINGMPITTRKAGRLFANLVPGESVELVIRREARLVKVAVVPKAVCPENHPMNVDLGRISDTEAHLDAVSEYLEALSEVVDVDIDLPELPELNALSFFSDFEHSPRVWFGMAISCNGCTIETAEKGSASRWSFDNPPEVYDVVLGGPADQAGLESGDTLTHIDGIPMDSDEGGNRFSSLEPGDTVTWTIRRAGKTRTVEMIALDHPNLDQAREDALEKASESIRAAHDRLSEAREHAHSARDLARLSAREFRLLLSESFVGGDVEVRGDPSVEVSKDDRSGEIIIRTTDATIRIRPSAKKQ